MDEGVGGAVDQSETCGGWVSVNGLGRLYLRLAVREVGLPPQRLGHGARLQVWLQHLVFSGWGLPGMRP